MDVNKRAPVTAKKSNFYESKRSILIHRGSYCSKNSLYFYI